MKKTFVIAAAATLAVTAAWAETKPSDVVFVDGSVAESLTGVAGDVANGRKLMNKGSGNCVACHAVTDLSELAFHGNIGPTLDGVADRWTEAELRGIVANAKMMFDGTMMPSFYKDSGFIRPGDGFTGKAAKGQPEPLLDAQSVEDVVAYLLTLQE
ncbi:MAG: sulfur oxidation c-type cytochrome SoxX [Paracoccaceae bacterium]|nr:sulfur oxidation c-type cytochrome SoxX [Paracoccaceae bacterium]